ncbi:uncharacterized protein VSU04_000629 isoform 2-T2 [Chlamydotis macqueenii]
MTSRTIYTDFRGYFLRKEGHPCGADSCGLMTGILSRLACITADTVTITYLLAEVFLPAELPEPFRVHFSLWPLPLIPSLDTSEKSLALSSLLLPVWLSADLLPWLCLGDQYPCAWLSTLALLWLGLWLQIAAKLT